MNMLTAQKMKFSIKDFFSKCDQIRRKVRIWSHLLKKSLMENFIFCEVAVARKEPCSCGDYAYTKLLQEIRYLEKCNDGLSGHPLAILANFIRELSL